MKCVSCPKNIPYSPINKRCDSCKRKIAGSYNATKPCTYEDDSSSVFTTIIDTFTSVFDSSSSGCDSNTSDSSSSDSCGCD